MNYANNITDLIGNTPLIKLNDISRETGNTVLGKCEFLNPTHSVKDRLAYAVIKDALEKKIINEDSVIIEPTSGNTGIGLAATCSTLGLRSILVMPSSMSVERRKLLSALGAELILTDPSQGMRLAVEKAQELEQTIPNAFIPQQFENRANVKIHRETTALEILQDTDEKIDIFVAGSGTSGTITGVGSRLKETRKEIQVVMVEPIESPLFSKGQPAPHKIQGMGPNFIPKIYDPSVVDEFIGIDFNTAINASRTIAKKEGLLVGISAGANIAAATQLAQRHKDENKIIVTILCDTGERYLNSGLYEYQE